MSENMRARQNNERRNTAAKFARTACIIFAALLANAALIVCLASQRDEARRPAPPQIRAVPLETAREDRPIVETDAEASVAIECEAEQTQPCPSMESLALDLPEAALDAPPELTIQSGSISPATPLFGFARQPSVDLGSKPATGPVCEPTPEASKKNSPCFTSKPVLLEPPNPGAYYPANAKMRGIEGTTKIRLEIDAAGRVTGVAVVESAPSGAFESAAKKLGRSLRFRPATRDGRPVASSVTLNLKWELEN